MKTLRRSGVAAATVVGGAVFAGTGISGSAALLAYFASSSALGKLPGEAATEQRRGNRRDAVQVLANGGVPALLALAGAIAPGRARPFLHAGFAGAVAAAAADTWATEIGSRARMAPRSIVTLQPVPHGASGGVTVPGLLASAAGAGLVAVVIGAGSQSSPATPAPLLPIALGGIGGSLVDSLLGATLQELRFCDICQRLKEQQQCCGEPTRRVRGIPGIDNDVVNALAVAAGALVTIVLFVREQESPGDV